jgi:hypothetical protein
MSERVLTIDTSGGNGLSLEDVPAGGVAYAWWEQSYPEEYDDSRAPDVTTYEYAGVYPRMVGGKRGRWIDGNLPENVSPALTGWCPDKQLFMLSGIGSGSSDAMILQKWTWNVGLGSNHSYELNVPHGLVYSNKYGSTGEPCVAWEDDDTFYLALCAQNATTTRHGIYVQKYQYGALVWSKLLHNYYYYANYAEDEPAPDCYPDVWGESFLYMHIAGFDAALSFDTAGSYERVHWLEQMTRIHVYHMTYYDEYNSSEYLDIPKDANGFPITYSDIASGGWGFQMKARFENADGTLFSAWSSTYKYDPFTDTLTKDGTSIPHGGVWYKSENFTLQSWRYLGACVPWNGGCLVLHSTFRETPGLNRDVYCAIYSSDGTLVSDTLAFTETRVLSSDTSFALRDVYVNASGVLYVAYITDVNGIDYLKWRTFSNGTWSTAKAYSPPSGAHIALEATFCGSKLYGIEHTATTKKMLLISNLGGEFSVAKDDSAHPYDNIQTTEGRSGFFYNYLLDDGQSGVAYYGEDILRSFPWVGRFQLSKA